MDSAGIHLAATEAVRSVLRGEEGRALMREVATESARTAIEDFLIKLGIDPSPAGLIAFQQNMQHVAKWRRIGQSGTTQAVVSFVGLLVVGAVSTVAVSLKAWLTGAH